MSCKRSLPLSILRLSNKDRPISLRNKSSQPNLVIPPVSFHKATTTSKGISISSEKTWSSSNRAFSASSRRARLAPIHEAIIELGSMLFRREAFASGKLMLFSSRFRRNPFANFSKRGDLLRLPVKFNTSSWRDVISVSGRPLASKSNASSLCIAPITIFLWPRSGSKPSNLVVIRTVVLGPSSRNGRRSFSLHTSSTISNNFLSPITSERVILGWGIFPVSFSIKSDMIPGIFPGFSPNSAHNIPS